MTRRRPAAAPPRGYGTDAELLARVLKPYKENCRYLTSASVVSRSGRVAARCDFSVPESCCTDDTGHLNAVESNICYNQMMYYLVARSVQEGLLAEFASWTMDDFWRHQLPDILIARFSGNFRHPIDPRFFSGEMDIVSVVRQPIGGAGPLLVADTSYQYWDANGGRCDGEAELAFVNIG